MIKIIDLLILQEGQKPLYFVKHTKYKLLVKKVNMFYLVCQSSFTIEKQPLNQFSKRYIIYRSTQ